VSGIGTSPGEGLRIVRIDHQVQHEHVISSDRTLVLLQRVRIEALRDQAPAQFSLVALIEHVMAEQKFEHVTDVLSWLAKAFQEARERGETLPWLPSNKTLQNTHARLAELFRLWSGSRYVRRELVTTLEWRPPGWKFELPKLVATQLSRTIVLHSPEDKISEPKKED
jgi:hypothetical protein